MKQAFFVCNEVLIIIIKFLCITVDTRLEDFDTKPFSIVTI